jgi:hypothetical protein
LAGGKAAEEFYDSLPQRCRYFTTAMNGYVKVRLGRGKVEANSWR